MTTHTPTPWKSAGGEIWGGSKRIATTKGGFSPTANIQRANAALIVRAVNSHAELEAALEQIASRIYRASRNRHDKDMTGAMRDDIERITHAALAKARE